MKHMNTNGSKPLGLVWIDCPYPVAAVGLARIFEAETRVHVGHEAPTEESPSLVILGADAAVEDLSESVQHVRQATPDALILVFGLELDMPLALSALRAGTRGFIYAGMKPDQVLRASRVAVEGELVAPRQLLEYMIMAPNEEIAVLDILSHRQREVLDLVAEGHSNAQIAKKLFLTESTVKQHLRAAYKLLGVKNRTEAARLVQESRNGAH